MHSEIEKLLNNAKEKGGITEHQRQLIISKAKQLGEDMVDVEFFLENIPIRTDNMPNVKDEITIESLIGNFNESPQKPSMFAINEGNVAAANNLIKRINPLNKNNKGCRKGCLSLLIIMVVLGLIGFIYDLIIGAF